MYCKPPWYCSEEKLLRGKYCSEKPSNFRLIKVWESLKHCYNKTLSTWVMWSFSEILLYTFLDICYSKILFISFLFMSCIINNKHEEKTFEFENTLQGFHSLLITTFLTKEKSLNWKVYGICWQKRRETRTFWVAITSILLWKAASICLRIINFVYVKLERRFQLATLRIINKLQFAS